MRLFRSRRAPTPEPTPADRVLDSAISVGEMPRTTLRELRDHAENIATRDYRDLTEKGMAVTIVYLVDELVAERRLRPPAPTLSQSQEPRA